MGSSEPQSGWAYGHDEGLPPGRAADSPDDLLLQREIRQARLAARRAGPIKSAIVPLPDSELEAPLEVPEDGPSPPAPSTPPLPEINGYLVTGELGSGGQGAVYKAVQESTGRKVAVKVLAGGRLASGRSRARFDREADILASLDHPNIVGIVDRGRTADGSFFIAMQFVDGCGLDDHLAAAGRDPRDVLPLLARIADAVGEAHRQGVVHRDIKPSNILIDQRATPHVSDFGLARILEEDLEAAGGGVPPELTRDGQILGSLPYLSPEQARGAASRSDIRSDVYALGVVCYQAITGQFPYDVGAGERQVLANIENAMPAPPSAVAPGLTPVLDTVVLRALEKSPHARYGTAFELARDLDRVIAGLRPAAAPPTFARKWKWLTAFCLAAVAAGASLLSLQGPARAIVAAPSPRVAGTYAYPSAATRAPRPDKPPEPTAPATGAVADLPAERNSIGMRFVLLPNGKFERGSPPDEPGNENDEGRQEVHIRRRVWMSVFEVTRRQYVRVSGRAEWDPQYEDPDAPAENITWPKAVAFCAALRQLDGRAYRLPTEAEWEYACRAGSTNAYGGNGKLDEMGWYAKNGGGRVHAVGKLAPNAWGLYDMHGNVFEWCLDYYDMEYPSGPADDPDGPPQGLLRVMRGGSAYTDWAHCRSANRAPRSGEVAGRGVGFRIIFEEPVTLGGAR